MDQSVASRPDTLTARLRRRFPGRYARKDARTLVLRLAYGQQSKLTTEVTAGPHHFVIDDLFEVQRLAANVVDGEAR